MRTTMGKTLCTALWLSAGVAGFTTCSAGAQVAPQYEGFSHPEQIPMETEPDTQTPKPSAAIPLQSTASAPAYAYTAPHTAQQPVSPVAPVTRNAFNPDAEIVTSVAPSPAETASDARPESVPAPSGDMDGQIVTRVEGSANELPIGAVIKVRLAQGISTKLTPTGTIFKADLLENVTRDGRVLLPAGSVLTGRVTALHEGKRISGMASIHLEAVAVTLPDGTVYRVHASVIDTGSDSSTKVDAEGTIKRRAHPRETVAAVALSTGAGAATGAVIAGGPGALIGAGVGAAVSAVVWLKEDRQAELPAGARIDFELTSPVAVGAP